MGDLVGRDGDGGDRAAVMVAGREPHGTGVGIVMISRGGDLHGDGLQAETIEQMAGKLAAGAGKVWPV